MDVQLFWEWPQKYWPIPKSTGCFQPLQRERKHRWGPTSPTAGLRARFDGGLRGPVGIIDKSKKNTFYFKKMLWSSGNINLGSICWNFIWSILVRDRGIGGSFQESPEIWLVQNAWLETGDGPTGFTQWPCRYAPLHGHQMAIKDPPRGPSSGGSRFIRGGPWGANATRMARWNPG